MSCESVSPGLRCSQESGSTDAQLLSPPPRAASWGCLRGRWPLGGKSKMTGSTTCRHVEPLHASGSSSEKTGITSKNCEIQSDGRMTTQHLGQSRQYGCLNGHGDQRGTMPHSSVTRGEQVTLLLLCTRRCGKVESGGARHVAKSGDFLLTSRSPVYCSHYCHGPQEPVSWPRCHLILDLEAYVCFCHLSIELSGLRQRGPVSSAITSRTITNRHDAVVRQESFSKSSRGPGRTFWCHPPCGGSTGDPRWFGNVDAQSFEDLDGNSVSHWHLYLKSIRLIDTIYISLLARPGDA